MLFVYERVYSYQQNFLPFDLIANLVRTSHLCCSQGKLMKQDSVWEAKETATTVARKTLRCSRVLPFLVSLMSSPLSFFSLVTNRSIPLRFIACVLLLRCLFCVCRLCLLNAFVMTSASARLHTPFSHFSRRTTLRSPRPTR